MSLPFFYLKALLLFVEKEIHFCWLHDNKNIVDINIDLFNITLFIVLICYIFMSHC